MCGILMRPAISPMKIVSVASSIRPHIVHTRATHVNSFGWEIGLRLTAVQLKFPLFKTLEVTGSKI